MCTQDELQIIMRKIVNTYYDIYKDDICNIYLYGSYARGDFGVDSDIDIVAIVKGNRRELQDKLKEVWNISSDMELDYEVMISPTVIPYEEFLSFKDTLPYYMNIVQEGVELSA